MSELIGTVPTVRGPVALDDLGAVLTHEHLFVRDAELHANFPSLWDEEAAVRLAAGRLEEAYLHGVRSIVDMTVLGQGRDLRLVERVAARTRVNIVMATGLYTLDGVPQIFRYRGPGTPLGGDEPIVDLLESDITVGIAGTDVRAALVKFACESERADATVLRLAAAAAEVHRRTDVPVVVHTDPSGSSAMTACDLLSDLAVPLDRVVLAHAGDIADAGLLRELATTGAFIGCDRLGMAALGSDEQRLATIVALITDGHLTQVGHARGQSEAPAGPRPRVASPGIERRQFEKSELRAFACMVLTRSRRHTATGTGTLVAFILVLVFGSPIFVDWVNSHTRADTAGGLFLRTLAWPAWSFNSASPVRDVLAQDLKAILFVVLVAVFLTLLAGAELSRARGSLADLFSGWAAVIFAAALAGFITAFLSVHAGLYTALLWALGGAAYGLITGWIVALAQQGTRRP